MLANLVEQEAGDALVRATRVCAEEASDRRRLLRGEQHHQTSFFVTHFVLPTDLELERVQTS
jgi:hypothetical protein